jgi:hypothetical protein
VEAAQRQPLALDGSRQTHAASRHPDVAAYLAQHAATPAAARSKLQSLGIIGADGKLTKPYK